MNGLFLLAIGFVFGKFVNTAIIQLSIWEKVGLLGLKPPVKSTFKIFMQQIFHQWGNDLTARCLTINLITAICFFTFWFRYGTTVIFFYCSIYFLFIEFFLFSWLEKLKVPEFIYSSFILLGLVGSYFVTSNNFYFSLGFIFLYILFNFTFKKTLLNKLSITLFNNLKFFVCVGVWFGIQTAIIIVLLSSLATIIVTDKKIYPHYFSLKFKYLNPLMCIFTLVYILFLFPCVL